MRYLRKFNTQEEYDNYLSSHEFVVPNVSLAGNKVYYIKENMRLLPLFVEAIEPLTVSFSVNPIEYSLDNYTWQTLPVGASTPTIEAGRRVYFRASGLTATSEAGIGTFSATGRHNIGGNIMSMLYGADYRDKDVINQKFAFRMLFINDSNLISAKNLLLPAMNLSVACYRELFYTCVNLVDSPALPATTLATSCYYSMFEGCTSLTTAPELPATELDAYCYAKMFKGDVSLTQAPKLPATVVKEFCYLGMYGECSNLEIGSDLPATDLTGATQCYNGMYNGCSKLRYLKAMLLNPSPNNDNYYGAQTGDWLKGVASSGVFVKNAKATWNVRGDHGIPSGWTIELADE